MKEEIIITTPQFKRTKPIENNFVPSNNNEFNDAINNFSIEQLIKCGFRKWDSVNNIVEENSQRTKSSIINIPIINSDTDETLDIDLGYKDSPIVKLEKDEDILLFPEEWYNIIPDNFIVTGLYAEKYPFKKGETDDDMRFGCLAYGITRVIN